MKENITSVPNVKGHHHHHRRRHDWLLSPFVAISGESIISSPTFTNVTSEQK